MTTDGGLAITTTPTLNELRLFALGNDGTIMEHHYTPATGHVPLAAIEGLPKADKNSPLAVFMIQGTLYLFWFDENHRLRCSINNPESSSWSTGS